MGTITYCVALLCGAPVALTEWRPCKHMSYEVLSEATPVFLFRNVTSRAQNQRLQSLARPRLLPSMAQGASTYRTSRNTFFGVRDELGFEAVERSFVPNLPPRKHILEEAGQIVSALRETQWEMLQCAKQSKAHPLIAQLVDNITAASFTEEGLQVTLYSAGEHYGPHLDDTKDRAGLDDRGRVATILHYLSAPAAGGDTVFPALLPTASTRAMGNEAAYAACKVVGHSRMCSSSRCRALVELSPMESCATFCSRNGLQCREAWSVSHRSCLPDDDLDPDTHNAKRIDCDRYVGSEDAAPFPDYVADNSSGAFFVCGCGLSGGVHTVPWRSRRAPSCAKEYLKRRPSAPQGLGFCCADDVLRVHAEEGQALLFFPRHSFPRHAEFPSDVQQLLWHASCTVDEGEKWVAQQWLVNRTKPWTPLSRPRDEPKARQGRQPRRQAEAEL